MKHATVLLALLSSSLLQAQVPGVEWMRTAGEFSQFGKHLSAVGMNGYIYTAARAMNPDYGNGFVVADEGIVLARYDSTGTIDWCQGISTSPVEFEDVTSIAVTSTGGVWVLGQFTSTTLTVGGTVLTNMGSSSSFLARYSVLGAVEEVHSWGGTGSSITNASDLCIDGMDRVHVTGATDATSITVDGVTMTNSGTGLQLYTLAFDANGTALWGVMSASPGGTASGRAISVDASLRTYIAGVASTDLVINGTTLPVGNQDKAVLLTFDNVGALTHMEVMADCVPVDMAVDDAGHAYVCGFVVNSAVFGNDTLVPSVLDGFVAAFPGNGTCDWVVGVSGAQDNEICYSVALDNSHTHLISSGIFTFDAWFGPLHVQSGMVPSDGFIMHLDTAGAVNWVKDMTDNGPTLYAQALYDANDRIHTSGLTQSTQIYLDEIVGITAPTIGFLARFDGLVMAVPQAEEQQDALVYPNPNNGIFTLDLPRDARAIIIADARGRELQRMAVRSSRSSFLVATSGVYFVSVVSDSGRTVQRIVVD
ncbi:MAG: T9SS type A sorting domain-containing protein [Flavobacteriales bacterium]